MAEWDMLRKIVHLSKWFFYKNLKDLQLSIECQRHGIFYSTIIKKLNGTETFIVYFYLSFLTFFSSLVLFELSTNARKAYSRFSQNESALIKVWKTNPHFEDNFQ
jgi:hypothetical protein